ncbi:hypothetical protein LTS10_012068 [Elasticomyces elasticus]|nr:hypothetical protein LTS10_012068 [Elasticomyces elasticus]
MSGTAPNEVPVNGDEHGNADKWSRAVHVDLPGPSAPERRRAGRVNVFFDSPDTFVGTELTVQTTLSLDGAAIAIIRRHFSRLTVVRALARGAGPAGRTIGGGLESVEEEGSVSIVDK